MERSIARFLPLLLLAACARSPATADATDPSTAATTSPKAGAAALPPAPPAGEDPAVSPRQAKALIMEAYGCRSPHCDTEINAGESEEEVAWLRRHGYPSPARKAAFGRMTDAALASDAGKGDLAAQVELASRLIEHGRRAEGIDMLQQASLAGSVYANYELSNAYFGVDNVDSAAYLRLAFLLGDAKAARELYSRFPKFGPAEWVYVDRRALRLYENLISVRSRVGGTFVFGPRPQ